MFVSSRGLLKSLVGSTNACLACGRRSLGYWWGHTTQEEIEAEEKKRRDGPIMAWQNPESDLVGVEKTASYVPMRVEKEEAATRTTYDLARFEMSDFYGLVNHPHGIIGYLKHPEHYYMNKKIKEYQKLVSCQRFHKERLLTLGPDLYAATFLVSRNCRVKFRDRNNSWVSREVMFKSGAFLPTSWQPGWYVEAIDASCSDLVYEAFNNMRNLVFLKSLDVSYCPQMDDWCLDRISGEFQDSLEELDVSGCSRVGLSGLESLWRLRKLKVLRLNDMDHIQDRAGLNLLCLMLMEELPDLRIVGVDYEDTEVLQGTDQAHLIADYEAMLLNPGSEVESSGGLESPLSPPPPFEPQQGDDAISDRTADSEKVKINQQKSNKAEIV